MASTTGTGAVRYYGDCQDVTTFVAASHPTAALWRSLGYHNIRSRIAPYCCGTGAVRHYGDR